METIKKKLVIVGDGAVGKTCLFHRFQYDKFDPKYIPTVYNGSTKTITISDNKQIEFNLTDTAGQEDYEALRPIAYDGCNVVLIAFAIDNYDSYENIEGLWISEVRSYLPDVPVYLVGCKSDLRHDQKRINELHASGKRLVESKQGSDLAKRINAKRYFESSALTGENVQEMFHELASSFNIITRKAVRKSRNTSCCILN